MVPMYNIIFIYLCQLMIIVKVIEISAQSQFLINLFYDNSTRYIDCACFIIFYRFR